MLKTKHSKWGNDQRRAVKQEKEANQVRPGRQDKDASGTECLTPLFFDVLSFTYFSSTLKYQEGDEQRLILMKEKCVAFWKSSKMFQCGFNILCMGALLD